MHLGPTPYRSIHQPGVGPRMRRDQFGEAPRAKVMDGDKLDCARRRGHDEVRPVHDVESPHRWQVDPLPKPMSQIRREPNPVGINPRREGLGHRSPTPPADDQPGDLQAIGDRETFEQRGRHRPHPGARSEQGGRFKPDLQLS